jgi:hypothetical protein
MDKIRKAVLEKITANYMALNDAFINGSRIAFFYGAREALVIRVGHRSWPLPIDKKRVGRPVGEAVLAILTETKVGAKIIKHAERLLILERAAQVKVQEAQARAGAIANLAVQLRTKVPVTFRE